MNINGKDVSIEGMKMKEIGVLLQEESPNRDGLGLTVKFTEREKSVLSSMFGLNLGMMLCMVVSDAANRVGSTPKKFSCTFNFNNDFFQFSTRQLES